MNYGIPYQGSKNRIVDKLLSLLPKAKHFYDVFTGGCAMTHGALLSGRYEHVHANDISDVPQMFVDAVNGKYHDEKRWISRENFFLLKDTDPYVRLCWSFGNGGRDYLYARTIEPWKRALHMARVWDDRSGLAEFGIDSDGSRADIKAHAEEYRRKYSEWYQRTYRQTGGANSVKSLCRLQRLERLETTRSDYRKLRFESDAVIYCDPPYKGTKGYQKGGFDHEAFYEWALAQDAPVFISEYAMPEDFVCIAEIPFSSRMNADRPSSVVEKLFIPRKQQTQKRTTPIQLSLFN